MSAIASQITSLTIVYSTVYSDADKIKHQSSASLAFVRGIHRGPVNSPHKWPVTRKMFPFDDVIMICRIALQKTGSLWMIHVQSKSVFMGMVQRPILLLVLFSRISAINLKRSEKKIR